MSLESSIARSPGSPTASDETNDESFKKDKNYRRYASNVDRALSVYETGLQEWADYISFLTRLLRALQSHPPTLPVVPNKVVVAQRLAQCLDPDLPSGVHQKTLEVYTFIFDMLQPERLASDLPLYYSGLAPILTFASLSVRPLFLSLVENFVVNLHPKAIRPELQQILTSLLPGLEEERSEDFETTLRIVDKFRSLKFDDDTVNGEENDGQFFWQCLFTSSVTAPSRRPGVLAYLHRYLPKLGETSPAAAAQVSCKEPSLSILAVTRPRPELLVECFSTGLADEHVLVQRNFLDLLVTHVPLHSDILQKEVSPRELKKLVKTATEVVTRRDMSLNRRLWSWFLGPEASNAVNETGELASSSHNAEFSPNRAPDNEGTKPQYFGTYGLKPVVESLEEMIQCDSTNMVDRAKPFRICLSLMDRWEVGGLIVPHVFLPIMRSIQRYEQMDLPKAQYDELFRISSAFFDGVESSLIFSELLALVQLEPSSIVTCTPRALDDLRLTSFIVSNFNLRDEEMLLIHIPLLLLSTIHKMKVIASTTGSPEVAGIRTTALSEISSIIHAVLYLLPTRAFSRKMNKTTPANVKDSSSHTFMDSERIPRLTLKFYSQSKESLELPPSPFSVQESAFLLFDDMNALLLLELAQNQDSSHHGDGRQGPILQEWVDFFVILLSKIPQTKQLRDRAFQPMYNTLFSLISERPDSLSFTAITSIISILTTLYPIHSPGFYITYSQLCQTVPSLVRMTWNLIAAERSFIYADIVRCLWLLHSVSWHDHLVEASITTLMIDANSTSMTHVTTLEQARRFFIVWDYSYSDKHTFAEPRDVAEDSSTSTKMTYQSALLIRPLFVALDLMNEPLSEASFAVKDWLRDLPSVPRLVSMVFRQIHSVYPVVSSAPDAAKSGDEGFPLDDANQLRYIFQTLHNVINALRPTVLASLLGNTLLGDRRASQHGSRQDQEKPIPEKSIQASLADVAIALLKQSTTTTAQTNPDMQTLQRIILLLLPKLLSLNPDFQNLKLVNMDNELIVELASAVEQGNMAASP